MSNELKILLADPEREMCEILVARLAAEGFSCVQADRLDAVWPLLEQHSFAAIVCEAKLSDGTALDLLTGLRQRNRDMPVIVLTAFGSVDWAKQTIRAGAFDYFDKPVDLITFTQAVRKAIRPANPEYSGPERRRYNAAVTERVDPALRDELTGLASHRFVLERLPAIHHDCNCQGVPLSLCLIDIDGFREFNQQAGLSHGDRLLIEVAKRLQRIVRTGDLIGRYGGDEFLLILPGADLQAAETMAKRIKANFQEEKWDLPDDRTDLPLCAGISEIERDEGADALEYLDRAIEAVSHAKLQGPGCIVTWRRSLSRETPFQIDLAEPAHSGPDIESINIMMWRFREMNRRLTGVTLDSMRLLVAAVEARDPYTKHHSVRVASFARYLAGELGLTESQVRTVHSAGLLHDIGKIGVPDAILTKPGKLTDTERELIRQHPVIAVNILEQTRFFAAEIPLVRSHHEWFNGTGYPDRLSGSTIPLGARIIQIADSAEAMLARRSYKDPYDIEDTLHQICQGAGIQFDPMITDLAVRLIRQGVLQRIWKTPSPAPELAAAK